MKREPDDVNEMTPEQIAAFRYCMGVDRGLTKWHCRLHVMTAPYIDVDCPHAGLDHVCDRRKNHKNRHRCWRCGLEIANDTAHYKYLEEQEQKDKEKVEQGDA